MYCKLYQNMAVYTYVRILQKICGKAELIDKFILVHKNFQIYASFFIIAPCMSFLKLCPICIYVCIPILMHPCTRGGLL